MGGGKSHKRCVYQPMLRWMEDMNKEDVLSNYKGSTVYTNKETECLGHNKKRS